MTTQLTEKELIELNEFSYNIRKNILKMIHAAKSGHPGGSLSAVSILTVLYNKSMNICPAWSRDCNFHQRDRFILTKGHASAALYAVLARCGYFDEGELMTFRKLGSKLQGHPSCIVGLPGIEASTGSLGQGLSIAVGVALGLRLDKNPAKVFVLMGDGELQEGNVWEAAMNASHQKLDNIIAIVDRNKLQIDGTTESIKTLGDVSAKFKAFGWDTAEINGDDLNELFTTIEVAKKSTKPFVIIANTVKGKGVSFMEHNLDWHGKAPSSDELETAICDIETKMCR